MRPGETVFFETFDPEAKSCSVPIENLYNLFCLETVLHFILELPSAGLEKIRLLYGRRILVVLEVVLWVALPE